MRTWCQCVEPSAGCRMLLSSRTKDVLSQGTETMTRHRALFIGSNRLTFQYVAREDESDATRCDRRMRPVLSCTTIQVPTTTASFTCKCNRTCHWNKPVTSCKYSIHWQWMATKELPTSSSVPLWLLRRPLGGADSRSWLFHWRLLKPIIKQLCIERS